VNEKMLDDGDNNNDDEDGVRYVIQGKDRKVDRGRKEEEERTNERTNE